MLAVVIAIVAVALAIVGVGIQLIGLRGSLDELTLQLKQHSSR